MFGQIVNLRTPSVYVKDMCHGLFVVVIIINLAPNRKNLFLQMVNLSNSFLIGFKYLNGFKVKPLLNNNFNNNKDKYGNRTVCVDGFCVSSPSFRLNKTMMRHYN